MKEKNKVIISWLNLGVILILLMVAVGGIVRLNNSGLSIVEWKPIRGVIPPLSSKEWQEEFDAYKKIPEYKIEHNHFKMNDFKEIYYLEYFHRLVARIVGFVFLIPFLFFLLRGYFKDKILLLKVSIIFIVAAFQAWLGWYMVSSGLLTGVDVSHYRLAVHLFVATILVSFVFWTALELKYKDVTIEIKEEVSLFKEGLVLLILTTFQLIYGAFMAGLRAGYYYTNYPKMGGVWFPKGASDAFKEKGISSFFEDPSMVHFIHRWFALILVIAIFYFFFKYKNKIDNKKISKALHSMIFIISLQFLLGIITLITKINISIAILHQVNGIVLFLSLIYLLFFSLKIKKI